MKQIYFIGALFLTLFSQTLFAVESKYISCIQCNYEDAESFARAAGAQNTGILNSANYVVFDPVSESVWTFYSEKYYESEMGFWVNIFRQIQNNSSDVAAVQAYNEILDKFYYHFGGENSPSTLVRSYAPSASLTASPIATVSDYEFIYNVVKGNTITPLPYPSYSWLKNDFANEAVVVGELAKILAIASISNSISLNVKSRLLKLMGALPLQFTVAFENGDTVTFVFDCLCSLPFIPLHETASDKDGNRLTSNTRRSGSSSGGGLGYDGFYNRVSNLGASVSRHCTTVQTGPSGNTSSQSVCYYIYN